MEKFRQMQICYFIFWNLIYLFCFVIYILSSIACINKLVWWKWCARLHSWSTTLEGSSRRQIYLRDTSTHLVFFSFLSFLFFLNDKNEIDTLMCQMKDGEASLQCASILFCCEEVPAVNFMLWSIDVRRQNLHSFLHTHKTLIQFLKNKIYIAAWKVIEI